MGADDPYGDAVSRQGGQGRQGGGNRVICTELFRQGLLENGLYRLDLKFSEQRLTPAHVRGYHLWAVPWVGWMRRSRSVTALSHRLARWRALEIAYQLGERPAGNWRGKIVRAVGEPLCWLLGLFANETDYQTLYEKETTT